MRKLGGVALLILLAAGVWVNSLKPAPHVKARKALNQGVGKFGIHLNGLGPKTILIASTGRETSDFNELVMTLVEANYSTIAIQHYGLNAGKRPSPETLKTIARPTINTLTTTPDQPHILIGHAYGNRVVRMAAHQNPANVKGVILLAAGGQVPMSPKAEQSLMNIFNPLRPYRSRMKDMSYAFFADENEIPDYWKRGWHSKAAWAQFRAKGDGDESWHCAGGVPMLIIQPMQDKIAPPANAYALRDKCPQEVEIIEVQNAGHALLPEQPEAVAKAVLDFLAKHHPVEGR